MAVTPIEDAPEPRKEAFTEKPLPDEPKSDVKLVMDSGMTLRERVVRLQTATGFSLIFTYTRLDDNGDVMLTEMGEPMIAPAHELALMGENVNRLGQNGLKDAIREARKVAAAQAVDHFQGIELMSNVMASRI